MFVELIEWDIECGANEPGDFIFGSGAAVAVTQVGLVQLFDGGFVKGGDAVGGCSHAGALI